MAAAIFVLREAVLVSVVRVTVGVNDADRFAIGRME